ncbi:hypothetical protein JCM14076_24840 [Methylosoma difficile]
MLNPEIITIATGVSSLLGLLGLIAYLYYSQKTRAVERSIKGIIEGEELFNAKQVVEILSQFKDDEKRLQALIALTNYSSDKAKALLTKVKENVDVENLATISTNHYLQIAKVSSRLFGILAAIGFVYSLFLYFSEHLIVPPNPIVPTSITENKNISIEIEALIKDFEAEQDDRRHNARDKLALMYSSYKNEVSTAFIKTIKTRGSNYRVGLGVLKVLSEESTHGLASKELMDELVTLKNSENMKDPTFNKTYLSAIQNQGN